MIPSSSVVVSVGVLVFRSSLRRRRHAEYDKVPFFCIRVPLHCFISQLKADFEKSYTLNPMNNPTRAIQASNEEGGRGGAMGQQRVSHVAQIDQIDHDLGHLEPNLQL